MRPRDRELANRLNTELLRFTRENHAMPGIRDEAIRNSFIEQILESVHRVAYVAAIRKRPISDSREDPTNELFDPLRAAILHHRAGDLDEAFWLVFLATHFGKHRKAGWRYARLIYGRLNNRWRWDWRSVSADPGEFRAWLREHEDQIRAQGGGFSNHRKYESLKADSSRGTGAAIASYVAWVRPPRTHRELIEEAMQETDRDPRTAFDYLYHSMAAVASFGRTARFDYLTMVGKLGLAPIVPGSIYLQGSTGPVSGARLLFGGIETAPLKVADLDRWLVELDAALGVGMQVLEDALCNWQKSPARFRPFRG